MPKNYEDLKNKVSLVKGLVQTVQVDFIDGQYISNLTWPFISRSEEDEPLRLDRYAEAILGEREGMPFWEEIDYEFHLMCLNARYNFDIFLKLGAKRIVFQLEAECGKANSGVIDIDRLNEFREYLESIDLYIRENTQIGISINVDTPIESLRYLVSNVDFIQCMGIENVGFQGEPFDERVIDQVKALRAEYPELVISVDGGVNLDTAQALIEAGADRLVVGSAIFNNVDIVGAIEEFKNLDS